MRAPRIVAVIFAAAATVTTVASSATATPSPSSCHSAVGYLTCAGGLVANAIGAADQALVGIVGDDIHPMAP